MSYFSAWVAAVVPYVNETQTHDPFAAPVVALGTVKDSGYPVVPIYADYDPGESRDPSGKWTQGPGGGSNKDKDPEPEYTKHVTNVERKLHEAIESGESTDQKYTVGGNGVVYTPERRKQQDEVLDEIWKEAGGDDLPHEGKAVISGGLGGAGKSTVLKKHAGIDPKNYLTINADDIKEKMAAKGMIPKIEGLSPMEAAALIHEESAMMSQQLAHRAQASKTNLIWDITMSSEKSVEKRLDDLRAAGYNKTGAVFVDIPVETSVERAMARHKRGHEAYQKGEGYGGRYVPPEIIRKSKMAEDKSKNRDVFDTLKPRFDEYGLWDNSGTAPKQIDGTGQWEMKDD